MKMSLLSAVLMFNSVSVFGQENTSARQIKEALMPLPAVLQDGATVVLDATPGKRTVLRTGTNGLICRANTLQVGFNVSCYPQEMDAFWTRFGQLTLERKTSSEKRDVLGEDARLGKLKPLAGAATYSLSGDSAESSLPLMAIFLPFATAESTGLGTERDHFRPWLMWAGTPFAHVMIPGK